MMLGLSKNEKQIIISLLMLTACAGCAQVVTKDGTGFPPDGIRVYLPRVYLLVSDTASHLFYAPDFAKPYDIKICTILAKQNVTLAVEDGMLKSPAADQDTSHLFSLLQSYPQLALKAAGFAVTSQDFAGNFGLTPGLYELRADGNWGLILGKQ